jgi:hypothetical protein
MRRLPLTITAAFLALAIPGPALATDYQKMDLLDVILDAQSLGGKNIETSGGVFVVATNVITIEAHGDSQIWVNINALSRDDRKNLFSLCAKDRCKAVLQGTVRKGAIGQWEIAADTLTVVP